MTRVGRLLALFSLLAFSRGQAPITTTIEAQSSGAAVDLKINFQDEATAPPAGYLRDWGQSFGLRTGTNQGNGLSYGWVVPGNGQPLSLVGNGRNRNNPPDSAGLGDLRLATLMHMQYSTGNGGIVASGAWEIAVPNGAYSVTVSVGDASNTDSVHSIRIEGQVAISEFRPTTAKRFEQTSRVINVTDERLTIDASGGTNTKINYVDIVTATSNRLHPFVTAATPTNNATGQTRQTFVSAEVSLPNTGYGVDENSLNGNTVRLIRMSDRTVVPANVNTSGGGDVIVLQPTALLDPNTTYVFQVTDGVKDLSGASFRPFSSTFTTGALGGNTNAGIVFDKIALPTVTSLPYTSLAFGPDNKLYAGTMTGAIVRYSVNSDGTLGAAQVINSLRTYTGQTIDRAVIGLAFDDAGVLWVSHGYSALVAAPDWSGKISRLTGSNLQNVQDYVINLPRSIRDHLTNSLAFGPDGKLYVAQGSNTAMGAPDKAWGERPERELTAAVLQIDPTRTSGLPIDVKTEEGGTYDPYATNAPVQIYATGVRNAYDLVWHSNQQLYAPTNSSAAGGNTPTTPDPLPAACQNRIDRDTRGNYTGPMVTGVINVPKAQPDYLYRVVKGGYYGHPNLTRCEWVLNGGNPTSGVDPNEIPQYAVGTQPDRNYRDPAYNFGNHYSPNGAIEYRSNVFGGKLRGKLLVARYSGGDDIIALDVGSSSNGYSVGEAMTGITGLTGLNDPLDLVEGNNGNLYVTEFVTQRIVLLRPNTNVASYAASIAPSATRLTFSAVQGQSVTQNLYISNNGSATLNATITKSGSGAARFQIATTSVSVDAGKSATVAVTFNAALGPHQANLRIQSNDPAQPVVDVALGGLGTQGTGGANEPSLQWILDTYAIPVNVGDPNPADNSLPTSPRLGEEVLVRGFEKAEAGTVTVEPLAVYGPTSANPVVRVGWYATGDQNTKNQLFDVSNSPASNGQTLNPIATGLTAFDPGETPFSFYSVWPFFGSRTIYGEDALNTFGGAIPHHVRVYPYKNSDGAAVPNTYVVAFEENTSGFDYQDVVLVVRNVKPIAQASTIYLPVIRR